jgi:hypothetical protein
LTIKFKENTTKLDFKVILPDFIDRAGGYIKKLEIKSELGNIEVKYDKNKEVVSRITRDQKFLSFNPLTR